MGEAVPGLRVVLAPASRKDIRNILVWSEERFGKGAALRYEALLMQGFRDLAYNPVRPGVSGRAYLPADVLLYHLGLSRKHVPGATVKEPRHFVAFRVTAARLLILRVLHDSRDLRRHLLDDAGV